MPAPQAQATQDLQRQLDDAQQQLALLKEAGTGDTSGDCERRLRMMTRENQYLREVCVFVCMCCLDMCAWLCVCLYVWVYM